MHLYFAYGSNLNLQQMARRCPDSRPVSPAVAIGYGLVFPRPDSEWRGGVAGITPDDQAHVEGAVYEISDSDLEALDHYEAVSEGEYTRIDIPVTLRSGSNITAITYQANPEPGGPFTPSPRYLRTMLKGARQHSLSPAWIKHLRQFGDPIEFRPWGFWATIGWTAACAFITLGITIVFTLITMALIGVLPRTRQYSNSQDVLEIMTPYMAPLSSISYAAAAAVCIPLLVLLAHWRTGNALGYLNLGRFRILHLVLSVIVLAGFVTCESFLSYALQRPIDDDLIMMFTERRWAAAVFLMLVVVAPLFEEIVFRGFMFRGIARSPAGPWGAVMITSFLFALAHLHYPPYEMLVVFFVGVMLGVIRLVTGSTLITITLHALGNLFAFIVLAIKCY